MVSRFDRSRRRFLMGAGAAVALPLLPSLMRSRGVRAAPGSGPLRFVVMYTANGQHRGMWTPSGSQTDWTLGEALTPLAPFQDKLAIVHGVRGNSGHHTGHAECLTGRPNGENFTPAGGPSLDQLYASRVKAETTLPSLELGVGTSSGTSSMINFSDAVLGIPAITSAIGGFDRVQGVTNLDPEEAQRRRDQKLSVVDAVMSDYAEVSTDLTSDERNLLDAHLELLVQQEASLLDPAPPVSCDLPAAPLTVGGWDGTARAHAETIATAFKCDVTRVATLMIGNSGESAHYDWADVNDDYHEVAHGAVENAYEKMLLASTWHAEIFAHLLAQLDAIPEGDGTLLDNTVVFWTGELGLHEFSHHRIDVPIVLAGGACANLVQGRYLDLGGDIHYHQVLLTLAHALGMNDVTTFGDDGTSVVETLFG